MIQVRFSKSRLAACATCLGVLLALASSAQAEGAAAPPPAPEAAAAAPPPAPAAQAPPAPPPSAAEPPPAPATEAPLPPATPAAKPKPPPYSLPWQLRPVAPGNVLRLDTAYGAYKNATTGKTGGSAIATSLLGSYKVIPDFAVIARFGLVRNSPPASPPPSATSILNPVLGGLYGVKLAPSLKLGLFLGLTLPIGSGGGTSPDPGKAAANGAGIATRSAMDNAMFAVNYFTVFPGVDFAFVQGGLTVQAEATIFKLTRARGPSTQDSTNTNFTTGLHVGYFIVPMFSIGAEIRHQRWLSTPASVKADKTDSLRDTTTFAVGPRVHLKLSDSVWFRPGLALALPLDDPMKKSGYAIAQLDLPFSF